MKFVLTMLADTDAFGHDAFSRCHELGACLMLLARELQSGNPANEYPIFDTDHNKIGTARFLMDHDCPHCGTRDALSFNCIDPDTHTALATCGACTARFNVDWRE